MQSLGGEAWTTTWNFGRSIDVLRLDRLVGCESSDQVAEASRYSARGRRLRTKSNSVPLQLKEIRGGNCGDRQRLKSRTLGIRHRDEDLKMLANQREILPSVQTTATFSLFRRCRRLGAVYLVDSVRVKETESVPDKAGKSVFHEPSRFGSYE